MRSLNIDHSFIGDYISTEEIKNIRSIADSTSSLLDTDIIHNDVSIGKNIKSSIYRYLAGKNEFVDRRVVQEYTFSALINTTVSSKAIQILKPKGVVMSHGIYTDWGPALKVALKNGLRVTLWAASYLLSRFYFRNIENEKSIDIHGINDSTWKKIKMLDFSKQQDFELNKYMSNRYTKNTSFDMREFAPPSNSLQDFKLKFNLDSTKPLWALLAHVNWDAVSDYSPMLFENFNEWIVESIKTLSITRDVQWLLKIHPAEVWFNPASGIKSLIKESFSELPINLQVIRADEKINPLDFFNLIDGAVTVYGTSGLELAMQGKPVILAGKAHYGNKGFTIDALSVEHYKKLLLHVSRIDKLTDSQIQLAKKYAYSHFIQRQIPISALSNSSTKWWGVQEKKLHTILPGTDHYIEKICKNILSDEEYSV